MTTPEDIVRRFTYDPTGTDPDPTPGPMYAERGKSIGALLFAILALLAIGVGIGAALP